MAMQAPTRESLNEIEAIFMRDRNWASLGRSAQLPGNVVVSTPSRTTQVEPEVVMCVYGDGILGTPHTFQQSQMVCGVGYMESCPKCIKEVNRMLTAGEAPEGYLPCSGCGRWRKIDLFKYNPVVGGKTPGRKGRASRCQDCN